MSNDATIQVRIDAKTKDKAAKLFKRFGMSTSEAVRIFINQALEEKSLTFIPHIPNAVTREAIEDARSGKVEKTSLNELRKIWNES